MNRKRLRMKKRLKKAQKRRLIVFSCFIVLMISAFLFIGIKVSAHLSTKELPSNKIESLEKPNENITLKPNDIETKETNIAFQDGKEVEESEAIDSTDSGTLPERQASKDKVAYLTFDDGPTENITPQILETLKKYDVKATFFVLGKMVKANPDMLKREYDEGHLIANHSYSHDYNYLYASIDNFKADMKKSEDLIKNTLNIESKIQIIRFPGGSLGSKLNPYKEAIIKDGYYPIDWNCLNEDAQGGKKTPDQLVQSVINTSKGKNELVILMHDASTKQATADSLVQVIEYLKSEGYRFDTLNNYY